MTLATALPAALPDPPTHELTLLSSSTVGRCRCGDWTTVGLDADDIAARFKLHAEPQLPLFGGEA